MAVKKRILLLWILLLSWTTGGVLSSVFTLVHLYPALYMVLEVLIYVCYRVRTSITYNYYSSTTSTTVSAAI